MPLAADLCIISSKAANCGERNDILLVPEG
jgi:hypothetical protein